MSAFLKNYGQTLLLVAGIVVGGVCGAIFGPAASAVKPIGDIFMNLLLTLVVPLVFFSIASSVCRLQGNGGVAKVFGWTIVVMLGMSLVGAALGYLSCLAVNPLKGFNSAFLDHYNGIRNLSDQHITFGQVFVSSLTVGDFPQLLSRNNLLPLIIFSALVGAGTSLAGEKGKPVAAVLDSGTEVIVKVVGLIMYVAPIGLGCYFADAVAQLGSQILGSYVRVFVIYCVIALVMFAVVNPLYILLFCGMDAYKAFWRNILPPALTAVATCSSAASMPTCIESSRRMGTTLAIAESVIPLGTNIHKNGSVVGNAMKAVFLLLLVGKAVATPGAAAEIIIVAMVSAIVVGAIPGGGMTGEILTCSMLGLDPSMAGIIIIIATIIDIPATLLNATGNVVLSRLVDRFVKPSANETE